MAVTATAILIGMLTFLPETLPEGVIYLLAFIFGGVVIPTYSLVIAHVNDNVGPGEFVAASGGLLIVQGAGAAVGPIAAGAAMSAFGQDGLPCLVIRAQILITLWGLYRMTQRAAPVAKEDFQVMPPALAGTELVSATQDVEARQPA
jgi:hypothetical protein